MHPALHRKIGRRHTHQLSKLLDSSMNKSKLITRRCTWASQSTFPSAEISSVLSFTQISQATLPNPHAQMRDLAVASVGHAIHVAEKPRSAQSAERTLLAYAASQATLKQSFLGQKELLTSLFKIHHLGRCSWSISIRKLKPPPPTPHPIPPCRVIRKGPTEATSTAHHHK